MGRSPATRSPARGGWPLAVGTRPQTKNNPATNQPAGIPKLRRPFSQHAAPSRARVERPCACRLRTRKKNRDHPRGREIAKVSNQTLTFLILPSALRSPITSHLPLFPSAFSAFRLLIGKSFG